MRIFLTGATGYIGSAVLDALVRAGHQVTSVVRTAEKAQDVASRGGRPVIGDLGDPASYRDVAEGHDGYIHTAYESSSRGPEVDRAVLETLVAVARQPGIEGVSATHDRFLVYTSGVWVLGNTPEAAAEDAPVRPTPHVAWRPAHEQLASEADGNGLRSVVVRPGIVYGGSRGIVGDLLKDASNGLIRIVGDGANRWPLIYDRDLGDLYARIAARPDASGIYHANDEGDERARDIAEAIAAHMPVKADIRHIPLEEARAKMGTYADALALDQVVRSPRARTLGWAPTLRSVAGNLPRLLEEWRAGDAQPSHRR